MRGRPSGVHARYGVDFQPDDGHMNVESPAQILGLLDGRAGWVKVKDRRRDNETFHGTVEEVRSAIVASAELYIAELPTKECPDVTT